MPLNGVTSFTKQEVLDALHTVTDHLPVVADYQVPAVMEASAAMIPTSIDLGSAFNLSVSVSNAADVVAVNGADVLHYSLTNVRPCFRLCFSINRTRLSAVRICIQLRLVLRRLE